MGWSRELGIVEADEVSTKLAQATADARGCLSEADASRRADILARLTAGQEVPRVELDELQKLNAKGVVKMTPEELATIDKVGQLAEAGVRIMGGRAHVSLGGHDRVDEQPESSVKGQRQTSITVTISTQRARLVPLGEEPAPAPPPKVVDPTVPWES